MDPVRRGVTSRDRLRAANADAYPPNAEQHEQDVELCFTSDQPLGEIEAVLRERGVTIVRGAADEVFGEQLQIESPDGLLVKINRLDPSTFS